MLASTARDRSRSPAVRSATVMADVPYRREYRFTGSRSWLGVGSIVPAAGAASLVLDMANEEMPIAVPLATGTAFAALFVFLARLVLATATISDERHLTIRGAFRMRSTAWPDVQGIEIEANPLAAEGSPRRVAVLYDVTGSRYALPYLNDRSSPDLTHEVAALREVWLMRRGENWRPTPEVAARIARRRAQLTPLWLIALLPAFFAFWVGMGIFVFALIAGVYPQDTDPDPSVLAETVLHPVALFAGLPAVASVTALVVAVIRRRR